MNERDIAFIGLGCVVMLILCVFMGMIYTHGKVNMLAEIRDYGCESVLKAYKGKYD